MRSLSTQTTAAMATAFRSEHLRITVKDAGGTWRDLSSAAGFDAVTSATVSNEVDGQHITANVTLKREAFDFSLAPLDALALGNNLSGSYSALLELGRELKIEVAIVAPDNVPASGDWVLLFHGRIDTIDDAQGDSVSLECRDLAGRIADTFIEAERAYGFGTPRGCRVWAPNTVLALNEYLVPSDGKRNGHYYKVTTAGTTSTTEPTWPTGGASVVGSGSVSFTEQGTTSTTGVAAHTLIQQLLDDNGASTTLYTPSAPTWIVRPYLQERGPLLDALRTVAIQIGWDVRMAWRAGTSQFELTFAEPDRAKTTADATLTPSQYESISALRRDISTIRNVVRVVYSDSTTLLSDGKTPMRKAIEVSDSASITKYGRLFCEIAEADASQIDTFTEASTLATGALSDLKDPGMEQEVSAFLYPAVELGDLLNFEANGTHYTTDQKLAVVGYSHDLSVSEDGAVSCRTNLTTRGKPAVAHRRWGEVAVGMDSVVFMAGIRPITYKMQDVQFAGGLSIAAAATVAGAELSAVGVVTKTATYAGMEWHISTVSGFTPTSATLVADGLSSTATVASLNPGVTYYAKAIPKALDGSKVIAGLPTAETSFVAGTVKSSHADPSLGLGLLNGSFEDASISSDVVPDRWTFSHSDGVSLFEHCCLVPNDTAGHGTRSLQLLAAAPTGYRYLTSDKFSLNRGADGAVTMRLRASAVEDFVGTCVVILRTYDDADGSVDQETISIDGSTVPVYPAWGDYEVTYTPDPSASRADVMIEASETVEDLFIDGISVMTPEGEVNTASNVGAGEGVFKTKTGADLEFRTLTAGSGIALTGSTNEIAIAKSAEQAWQTPTLTNSWVNYGAGFASAQYYKGNDGIVRLKGLVKSGTVSGSPSGAAIFTLPVGYRPAEDIPFVTVANGAFGYGWIRSSGYVQAEGGSNTWFSISGLWFRV